MKMGPQANLDAKPVKCWRRKCRSSCLGA